MRWTLEVIWDTCWFSRWKTDNQEKMWLLQACTKISEIWNLMVKIQNACSVLWVPGNVWIFSLPPILHVFSHVFSFLMWTTFQVFIEFVVIVLLFMFWFFGHEPCSILASWPGIEPAPLVLEGEDINTGPSGKLYVFSS